MIEVMTKKLRKCPIDAVSTFCTETDSS